MANGNGNGDKQTYYAKSMYSDPVMIATFAMLALQLDAVTKIIPETWLHSVTALTAVLNLFLRVFTAQRPVAHIPPGQVKPVEVKSLQPTPKENEQ